MARETSEERKQRLANERFLRERKAKGQRQEAFIAGSLLNTTTYIIIFLLLIFGLSAREYQRQPDKYSWLDLNAEGEVIGFKEETYDVIVSYNLDTPLDELNGNSLREVFEEENLVLNGDFTNGLNDWNVQFQSQTNISVVNGRLTFNGLFSGDSLRGQDILIPTGNEYYVTWNASQAHTANNDFDVVFAIYSSYSGIVRYSSVVGTNSLIRNAGANGIRMFFQVRNTPRTIDISFDDIYVLDLDALGINQTKDEMDYWYSEYQRLQENRIEDMKYLGGLAVSSWTNTIDVLTTIGGVMEDIYKITPIGLFFSWLVDIEFF